MSARPALLPSRRGGEFFDSVIKKIVHRMQNSIDLNGDYVEK
jgi:hypothetical protein